MANLLPRFKARHVAVAMDSQPYWRTSIYPHYKANRTLFCDPEVFYCLKKEIEDGMKSIMPNFIWVKIPKAEGDDIIAALANLECYDEIVVFGSDSDFGQLDALPKVRRFNPVKKQFIERLGDPGKELLIKIICGDSGDNIPGVKKGTGPKRALKMINEGKLDDWLDSNPEYRKAFTLNSRLIDFSYIPADLKSAAMSEFQSQLMRKAEDCDIGFLKKYMAKTSLSEDLYGTIASKLNGDWA
jgi:5'-3' exonuclease